jgi:hypothetical protein
MFNKEMTTVERLPDNGNNDITECEWIVYLDANESGARRVVVKATSEMGAIITAEEELGVTAISARPRLK